MSQLLSLHEAPMLPFRQTHIGQPPPDSENHSSALVRTELQESPIEQLRPAGAQIGFSVSSDNLLGIPASEWGTLTPAGTDFLQRSAPLLSGAPLTDPTIEAVTDELDEAGLTETYAEYNPKKCMLLCTLC